MALNKTTRNAIADDTVTSANIEDGAITSGKLGAGTISLSKTPLGNAAPTISSLDTSTINPSSGATVTITGTGFVTMPEVKFMNTTTGVRITPSSVGFTSSTTLTATFPASQTVGTYKVVVENPDGKGAISTSTILYSAAPTWSTSASLGSVEEGESVNISLLAYDDNSTAVSSYSLVAGSLPSGVTLSGDSSVGALTGTAPAVDADTNFTFTIRATDADNQTSDREFTLTVTNWQVDNSLRFDDGSSDYLNRTPVSAGNRKTWTYSTWIKRSNLPSGSFVTLLQANHSSSPWFVFGFYSDKIELTQNAGVSSSWESSSVYRDVSAWYHLVLVVDTTSATTTMNGSSTDRMRVYVNNEQIVLTGGSVPTQNSDLQINNSVSHTIGGYGLGRYFDGYMTETVLVDGTALDPTSFGETDTDSGIWIPKKISGLTFGTNGFYLPFTNSSSLGADSSGNSNDFTVNNLTSIDKVEDTPQNNYTTLNSILDVNAHPTYTEGNLKFTGTGSTNFAGATIPVSSGKWYVEVKATTVSGSYPIIGVIDSQSSLRRDGTYFVNSDSNTDNPSGFAVFANGDIYHNNSSSYGALGTTYTSGDIIGMALDMDASPNTLRFYKNGTLEQTINLDTAPSGYYMFAAGVHSSASSAVGEFNFGNPSFSISSGNSDANGYGNFEYAVPSGYFALNTKNLYQYG